MKLKKYLEYALKHNSIIQNIYKISMSFILQTIGSVINTKSKTVLFSSFGGRKYNDSPKVLFEAMRIDPRFADYEFVWAFEEPSIFNLKGARSIQIDSWEYFKTALQAKVWITCVNIERGLRFKKEGTIYVNTWHGAGIKKVGNACRGRSDYDFSNVDILLVQSDLETEIFRRDFLCNLKSIRMIGFPRNDELYHMNAEHIASVRRRLNIPESKRVILYAPTWRDSEDGGQTFPFNPPIHIEKWNNILGSQYVVLSRMHPFTTDFSIVYDDFIRDVTQYENLNELIAVSNVVITDYSSIVYDSVIAGHPFVCFGFDYESYKMERGFDIDPAEEFPGGVLTTEDDVIKRVLEVDNGLYAEEFKLFKDKYAMAGGNATEMVLDELYQKINGI